MITGQINLHLYTVSMHLIHGCTERSTSNPSQEFTLTNMIPSDGAEPFSRGYSQSS
ncbi:hypothetical protein IMY05_018G0041900 [Salix suchowensis]|nr:hypothetical protein IMY05_018G0041900 [Salix suchowensis]